MALADRPDGTLPFSPLQALSEDGGFKDLIVSRRGDLYVVTNTPQPFDHKGHVVWHDNCQSITPWYEAAHLGDVSAVAIADYRSYNSAVSIQMQAGTDQDDYVQIVRGLPGLVAGRIGVELRVAFPPHTVEGMACGLKLEYYTGAMKYTFGWRYQDITPYGSDIWTAGAWTANQTDRTRCGMSTFNVLKLVINLTSLAYVRALLDGWSYDISGIAVSSAANTDPKGLDLTLETVKMAGGGTEAEVFETLIGQVLVTDQEPA